MCHTLEQLSLNLSPVARAGMPSFFMVFLVS